MMVLCRGALTASSFHRNCFLVTTDPRYTRALVGSHLYGCRMNAWTVELETTRFVM